MKSPCSLSPHIISVILPFSVLFSSCSWRIASTLLLGGILARGKRTVTAVLRTIGLSQLTSFSKYHRILNKLDWSPKQAAFILMKMILELVGEGRPIILIDETLERRKGKKIRAKGYYRDAVRSSNSQVVKATGLKWLVMAISIHFKFAKRAFALPFFSVLEPSKKSLKAQGKRHKTTLDWSVQMVMQLVRWFPNVPFILVGDGGFACAKLALICFKMNIALVSRLKMNARIYAIPEPSPKGKRGRKSKKGARLISFKEMIKRDDLPWEHVEIKGYDGKKKKVKFLTNTSIWGVDSYAPIAIRWVLVVDPSGEMDPLPLMSTDVNLSTVKIIELYVDRWGLEVTFQEVREHLGVETQRQWSDQAIARTTPILMAMYSIVCLIGNSMHKEESLIAEKTAWYDKKTVSFSDLIKAIRAQLWRDNLFFRKGYIEPSGEIKQEGQGLWRDWLAETLARAA